MSNPAPNPTPDPEPADRINRLEETAAFADRSLEQLSEEVLLLNRRLHDAGKRIARLEEALERVVGLVESQEQAAPTDPAASDDADPSSAASSAATDQDYRDHRPPHASGRVQGY